MTSSSASYFESRGGRWGSTVFFGLQYLLKEYLAGAVVNVHHIDEAADFCARHGEPFNKRGWERLSGTLGGHLPLRIKAVPEGTVVPTHNVLCTVESTDPDLFWLASWVETMMVRLWYPITVATQSHYIKRRIWEALAQSSDDPKGEIPFKLHDFGARGVSSSESAGIGGMAHLVNFMGSDTVEGVRFANHYYDCPMAGFSIPAAEHSTITMWGREREADAYRNMLTQFGGKGKLVACVSDSWNFFNAVENLWAGDLLDEVKATGGTLVIRPDSGEPTKVVLETLRILERKVGMTKNMRGYKVLPSYFRIIQGDGVDENSIADILTTMLSNGYSATNIAFGCGGALLQRLDRDTLKFAFKCSSATIDGKEVDVYKDPATDSGKKSKRGKLALIQTSDGYRTVPAPHRDDLLETVFENGKILKTTTLNEVRARVDRVFEQ